MSTISGPAFTRKLREVVADEPKAFAYDLGLSLSAVYNYLNGRIPATEVLFRIARYTGRPMEWFLVDEDATPAMAGLGPGAGGQRYLARAGSRGGKRDPFPGPLPPPPPRTPPAPRRAHP